MNIRGKAFVGQAKGNLKERKNNRIKMEKESGMDS